MPHLLHQLFCLSLRLFACCCVRYLNALTGDQGNSYTRPSVYGTDPTPSPTDLSPNLSQTIPLPTPEMITHGPAANIFSRTAFFYQQPFTPKHTLQLIVKQLLLYLNFISRDYDVVKETLELFEALSLNYSTSSHIASLSEVKQFLTNTPAGTDLTAIDSNSKPMSTGNSGAFVMTDMSFLHSTSHPKLQTTFFQIVSRLVFKGANIDYFPQFIQPFTVQLQQLSSIPNLRNAPPNVLAQVGLLIHKLHGVVSSINSMVVYGMFFEWFFETNKFASLVVRMVETFWDRPEILYPILNFYGELIWNKSQRIRFDSNSANGIILFKETYKIVSTYISRMIMTPVVQEGERTGSSATAIGNELYERRLKGISKVLMLVSNLFSGGYVNAGIMQYYQDPTLKQCIQQTLQYAMSVRFAHIINYPKVANFFFHFTEILFRHHCDLIVEICDTPKFLALISSLHEGLLSVQHQQVMEAASAIDHLMEWQFKQQKKQPGQEGNSITG